MRLARVDGQMCLVEALRQDKIDWDPWYPGKIRLFVSGRLFTGLSV